MLNLLCLFRVNDSFGWIAFHLPFLVTLHIVLYYLASWAHMLIGLDLDLLRLDQSLVSMIQDAVVITVVVASLLIIIFHQDLNSLRPARLLIRGGFLMIIDPLSGTFRDNLNIGLRGRLLLVLVHQNLVLLLLELFEHCPHCFLP